MELYAKAIQSAGRKNILNGMKNPTRLSYILAEVIWGVRNGKMAIWTRRMYFQKGIRILDFGCSRPLWFPLLKVAKQMAEEMNQDADGWESELVWFSKNCSKYLIK